MRLILTAALWFLILGGTWTYVQMDNGIKREASIIEFASATGITKVQIDRTFDCFGDAEFGEPAIKVTFGGKDVFLDESASVPADKSFEFELDEVEQQRNTLTVYANALSPDSFGEDGPAMRAMVVRVLHDDALIAERIFYDNGSEPSLGGDVSFEVVTGKDDPEDHQ